MRMEGSKRVFVPLLAIAVILTVLIWYSPSPEEGLTCSGIEQELRANSSLNGTTSCYAPDELNGSFDVPPVLRNRTDLRCICINEFEGDEKIFPISIAPS